MSIVLIGMMGCGKSAIARSLEENTGLKRLDADSMIESMEGMSIKDMFEIHDETFFRDAETSLLKSLKTQENVILATGGGMVVREENRLLLKSIGTVVYLRAKADTLIDRLISESEGRPLLKDGVKKNVLMLLENRATIYESCADLIVDVDKRSIDVIIQEILSHVSVQ